MSFWKQIFRIYQPTHPQILSEDFCEGKSVEELINTLEFGYISLQSGNRVLIEILKRLSNHERKD